jgi:hypothetical protein
VAPNQRDADDKPTYFYVAEILPASEMAVKAAHVKSRENPPVFPEYLGMRAATKKEGDYAAVLRFDSDMVEGFGIT